MRNEEKRLEEHIPVIGSGGSLSDCGVTTNASFYSTPNDD
jgi:hypothetical protein